jgi:hypothetical protein
MIIMRMSIVRNVFGFNLGDNIKLNESERWWFMSGPFPRFWWPRANLQFGS